MSRQIKTKKPIEELDLHWTQEEPDFGQEEEGRYFENVDEIIPLIEEVKTTVKKINLNSQEGLTAIPAVLGECTLLEELDISYTPIKEIPDFIFTLPNLRSFSCLPRFAAGISKAKNLENLEIEVRKEHEAEEICSLVNLKSLTLGADGIIPLPEDLGNLKNLEEFTFWFSTDGPGAVALPSSFASLSSLKKISIEKIISGEKKVTLDLDQTAATLASCPKLESLTLHGFDVGNKYKKLSLLARLKELILKHINLEEPDGIFEPIANLSNLETLVIYGSEFKIKNLPDIFTGLTELRNFILVGSLVQNLPPSIYNLEKMENLEIGAFGITEIDEKIGKMHGIKVLRLYDNMLKTLPESIFELPHLELLNIERNNFSKKEIAAIKNKLKALQSSAATSSKRKIEFFANGQGYGIKTKKLLAMSRKVEQQTDLVKDFFSNKDEYYKSCLEAVRESSSAIKYIDNRMESRDYYALCEEAIKTSAYAIKYIDSQRLKDKGRAYTYFSLCRKAMENAKGGPGQSVDVIDVLPHIQDNELSDREYLQICLLGAAKNGRFQFLEKVNHKRLSREDYERICWAAIVAAPDTIYKMIDPTPELCLLAAKYGCRLSFIPEDMRTYEICAITTQNGDARYGFDAIPQQHRDAQMYMYAVQHDGYALSYVPEEFKTEEMCLAAVSNPAFLRSGAFNFVPDKFKTKEFCLAAVKNNSELLKYIPDEFKTEEICCENKELL